MQPSWASSPQEWRILEPVSQPSCSPDCHSLLGIPWRINSAVTKQLISELHPSLCPPGSCALPWWRQEKEVPCCDRENTA